MNGLESVCLSHEDPPRPHQPKTSLGLVMIMMMMMMMLMMMVMSPVATWITGKAAVASLERSLG